MYLQKDYNRRFAKEPLHDFNAYRPLALDDDLDAEKRPLREGFSQRPFQHMDISNEPVIRHFH